MAPTRDMGARHTQPVVKYGIIRLALYWNNVNSRCHVNIEEQRLGKHR